MGIERFTATLELDSLDFPLDEVPDELPQEVGVYRPDWGGSDDVRVGVARDLRYCGEEDADGYRPVKAEMTILDPDPDETYSLLPPCEGDGWRVYAL